jgi:TRAP-type C4-dicarboxylate transport system substrate-binding protein
MGLDDEIKGRVSMRRTLIAAAVALASVLALPMAQAQTEIRISTAAPDNSPLSDAFRMIKARMEAKFPGAVKVSVHTASNLFRDADHLIKTFRSDIGREYYADVASKMGLVILDTAYLGTRTINLSNDKKIEKPSDLAGTKMRMPPGAAFQGLAKALGATPVSMPITEVYLALKTGAIDAQDNPTNMTRDWKFHEVTKQVVLTRHLVQPVFLAMAKPAFDKLTPAQQTELRAAAREAADVQIAKTLQDEKAAIETFRAANIRISEPDPASFRAAVLKEYEGSGMTAKWKPGLLARVQAVK